MAIKKTTKIAFQSALAIAIAELLSYLLHLNRGYWVTLTAMALTTQTWGESLKRSLERVSMTILGGAGGTILYWIIPQNQFLILTVMMFFIFFTVYLIQIYHLAAMIALTGFVVFLFALFGDWNLYLLRERILDTGLGALIALLVSTWFLPVRTDVAKLFASYIEKLKSALKASFVDHKKTLNFAKDLYIEYQAIRKNALAISYEMMFYRMNGRDFQLLLTQAAFCTHYIIALIESNNWLDSYLSDKDKKRLQIALETTFKNLSILQNYLIDDRRQPMLSVANISDILTKAIQEDPKRFASLDPEALGFFNLMYFFTRLNTRLHEINSLFQSKSLG